MKTIRADYSARGKGEKEEQSVPGISEKGKIIKEVAFQFPWEKN